MSGVEYIDIRFPAHVGIPKCRPGESVAGAVFVNCAKKVSVRCLKLHFVGWERVNVDVHREGQTQPKTHSQVYFHETENLVGHDTNTIEDILHPGVHLFHFTCTMPPLNFPVTTHSSHLPCFPCPDYEVQYAMQAALHFTQEPLEPLYTKPAPIHPVPIAWPTHLLPHRVSEPRAMREAAYERNTLVYHLQLDFDKAAYSPGDTVRAMLKIIPVVPHAPPTMGELDMREQCECFAEPPQRRADQGTRANVKPVWSRTRVLFRQALAFTKGGMRTPNIQHSKLEFKIPRTVCPVASVHLDWHYTINVTLFQHLPDHIQQSIGTFPIHLVSGLVHPFNNIEGAEQRIKGAPHTFPKHELQPSNINQCLYQPTARGRCPTLKAIRNGKDQQPLASPGLLKHMMLAPSMPPSAFGATHGPLAVRNVVDFPLGSSGDLPALTKGSTHQALSQTRDYQPDIVLTSRPTVTNHPLARANTYGPAKTRPNRRLSRANAQLLEVDVGESFEKLISSAENTPHHLANHDFLDMSSDDDAANANVIYPHQVHKHGRYRTVGGGTLSPQESRQVKETLKTLTILRPKLDSFIVGKLTHPDTSVSRSRSQPHQALDAHTSPRAQAIKERNLRYRTCVIGPTKPRPLDHSWSDEVKNADDRPVSHDYYQANRLATQSQLKSIMVLRSHRLAKDEPGSLEDTSPNSHANNNGPNGSDASDTASLSASSDGTSSVDTLTDGTCLVHTAKSAGNYQVQSDQQSPSQDSFQSRLARTVDILRNVAAAKGQQASEGGAATNPAPPDPKLQELERELEAFLLHSSEPLPLTPPQKQAQRHEPTPQKPSAKITPSGRPVTGKPHGNPWAVTDDMIQKFALAKLNENAIVAQPQVVNVYKATEITHHHPPANTTKAGAAALDWSLTTKGLKSQLNQHVNPAVGQDAGKQSPEGEVNLGLTRSVEPVAPMGATPPQSPHPCGKAAHPPKHENTHRPQTVRYVHLVPAPTSTPTSLPGPAKSALKKYPRSQLHHSQYESRQDASTDGDPKDQSGASKSFSTKRRVQFSNIVGVMDTNIGDDSATASYQTVPIYIESPGMESMPTTSSVGMDTGIHGYDTNCAYSNTVNNGDVITSDIMRDSMAKGHRMSKQNSTGSMGILSFYESANATPSFIGHDASYVYASNGTSPHSTDREWGTQTTAATLPNEALAWHAPTQEDVDNRTDYLFAGWQHIETQAQQATHMIDRYFDHQDTAAMKRARRLTLELAQEYPDVYNHD
ncbi:hypothetical protein H4R34_001308 [Dimargaris verticillata]|uniref:Arrestin-like N-terminal domain-containing protein n=1 Tax=Dimargaris verticillata TaxID=2761393 RepID=A0A9W8B5Q8_9FUNG|nr:hypothetical protein H4R34_001308 [Dimargaris verticillata]